jgi:hypothetical protein
MHNGLKSLIRETNLMKEFPSGSPKTRKSQLALTTVCPRLDIAYIWKASPSRGEKLSDEEKEIIRQHYPRTHYMEILKMLPSRTWQSIQGQAALIGVRREIPADRGICVSVCYKDLAPKLDGKYLFRDYETTLEYIKKAASNTAKSEAPLYALWIFSETVESLTGLVQRYLRIEDCLSQAS